MEDDDEQALLIMQVAGQEAVNTLLMMMNPRLSASRQRERLDYQQTP